MYLLHACRSIRIPACRSYANCSRVRQNGPRRMRTQGREVRDVQVGETNDDHRTA